MTVETISEPRYRLDLSQAEIRLFCAALYHMDYARLPTDTTEPEAETIRNQLCHLLGAQGTSTIINL